MPNDLFFRTEDIRPDEVLQYLVETPTDREIIDYLKGRSPVILNGSRGVGKSFLFRVASAELAESFNKDKILPVYVTFARAGLIRTPTHDGFLAWMMAKLCNRIVRASNEFGVAIPGGSTIAALQGGGQSGSEPSPMEAAERFFEDSWRRGPEDAVPPRSPDPEVLRDAVEDLCRAAGISRIALFIDEAAHVFIPAQQRQFFTLMRDLRSPYISVKAAVYPGVTAYGPSFQPIHDATLLNVHRLVTHQGYARSMREMVYKQDTSLRPTIERRGEEFDTLAYAATGNPRVLLKTLIRSTPLSKARVQATIREYYREEIWAEHTGLAERYPGHRALIDWGRQFIEQRVLPDLHKRNRRQRSETSSYLWIHRDSPPAAHEALRLLCYSGILQEGDSGIRATRSEIGTRYMVNLGCQFSQDADPIAFGASVRKSLSVRRMIEYGAHHAAYEPIHDLSVADFESDGNQALNAQLQRPSGMLDVTPFQRAKLAELGLHTIGDVLAADEGVFMQAHYIGAVRTKKMRNAAVAAVLEYLSG